MAKLIDAALTSLDGYVADAVGNFDWAVPDKEVHSFILFVAPIIVGSGNPYLPGNVRVELELLDHRGFDNGMVHARYRAKS